MTLKEADEAARMFLPVIYNGIEYKRITRVGYYYDTRKGKCEFIELIDKNGNSFTNADPKYCTTKLDEYKKEQKRSEP